jgi:hypothetical protein
MGVGCHSRGCMRWRSTGRQCRSMMVLVGLHTSVSRIRLTTLRVPTSTLGGVFPALTMSEMKLAVMPMMEMRETACMPLTTVKVAPRAPCVGGAMMNDLKDRGVNAVVADVVAN